VAGVGLIESLLRGGNCIAEPKSGGAVDNITVGPDAGGLRPNRIDFAVAENTRKTVAKAVGVDVAGTLFKDQRGITAVRSAAPGGGDNRT